MLPKIFKAKTNDVVRAIALTKAGEAEFLISVAFMPNSRNYTTA